MIFNMLFAFLQDQGDQGGFGGGSLVSYLLMIGLIFLVFYFLVFRPERKRKAKMKSMINELKAGDKVITIGGIHGTVAGITDETVVVRVADNVKVEFNRQAIGTIKQPEVTVEKKQSK